MDFYDCIILRNIGKLIRRLLKVVACTSVTLRGRYVFLCVQVHLDTPLKTHVQIGSQKKLIMYKGENQHCKSCCLLCHFLLLCLFKGNNAINNKTNLDSLAGDSGTPQ